MSHYRRLFRPGGMFFLTLVTENRRPFLCDPTPRRLLHESINACRQSRPFTLDAIILLPDHLHLLITLPDGDTHYPQRIAAIKAVFTRTYLATGVQEQPRSQSRLNHRNRGIWQRRYWEHTIRDEADLERHLQYIHYNPVKHGLASCPHAWPYSTFPRWVERGLYDPNWLCACSGHSPAPPHFDLPGVEMD